MNRGNPAVLRTLTPAEALAGHASGLQLICNPRVEPSTDARREPRLGWPPPNAFSRLLRIAGDAGGVTFGLCLIVHITTDPAPNDRLPDRTATCGFIRVCKRGEN